MPKRKRGVHKTPIWVISVKCKHRIIEAQINRTDKVFTGYGCICSCENHTLLACEFQADKFTCVVHIDVLGNELVNPRVVAPRGFNIIVRLVAPDTISDRYTCAQ